MEAGAEEEPIPPPEVTRPYQLINQRVDLEVDFGQRVSGITHLTIFPNNPEVRTIRLHARQCHVHDVTINGLRATVKEFQDPCDTLTLHTQADVHQHHLLSDKLDGSLAVPPVEELVIALPDRLKIEFNPEFVTQQAGTVKAAKLDSTTTNDAQAAEGLADTQISRYTRLDVSIKFSSIHTRDALHFAIGGAGAGRWPHVYTRGGFQPGRASCIFPCIDDIRVRCTWEFSIKAPKTVGDALRQIEGLASDEERKKLSATYEAREMVFVCPGEVVDDAVDKNSRQRTVSFIISQNVAAEQIGFAIGPFEKTDLNVFREAEEAEMLQDKAVSMRAYCLPGRQDEIENTCLPMTRAMDFIVKNYTFYPYNTFAFCFVDDHDQRPEPFAGISMCSTRLLYPENVIDNAKDTTRMLVNSIASQWMGVQILPEKPVDAWVTTGSSLYVTEHFMRELCGRNEYRYHMKNQSDRVVQLDHNRPSIYDMGALLHVDSAEYEFLAAKAPVVLYILDRRIAKTTGAPKVASAIAKIMSRARNEDLKDNLVSTEAFMERVEKLWYNTKSDDFINQWIKGAGCPRFEATQRFNKKKMVIEMTISQKQGERNNESELSPSTFMRNVREDLHTVYDGGIQNIFTGPMTIRIHEADGTPYEHIVEIKDRVTPVEVPYNTKYKRLKRSKRQKARIVKTAAEGGEEENDALVYCLGDTLQTEEDVLKWHLTEWSEEDEIRMNAESFEWIRLDADFEWIAAIRLGMPGYMFASQLQQDRDVAAQLVSIQHIETYQASPLVSTILVRTMMDARYFHAIRTACAHALVKHATYDNDCNMIGLFHLKMAFEELYCTNDGDSVITLPNDFSDQLSYHLQCALIEAISRVRDAKGYSPREVKEFLLDKLRFNDNSINAYSDAHYISTLMRSLASCLTARPPKPATSAQPDLEVDFDLDDEVSMRLEAEYHELLQLEQQCLAEIDRYRRMDEWTSSHQNLYARTALECQALLAGSNIGTFSPIHYLQYTRPGNYDMLRATAYDILATLDLFTDTSTTILRYIVHCLVADPSPYIRHRLRAAFGRALARKAIGEHKVATTAEPSGTNPNSTSTTTGPGLVIEEISLEDKAQATLRRHSLEAALEALKKDLQPHQPLQQYLYAALIHPDACFEDIRFLLEFCSILYDTKNTAIVILRKPRYWKLELEGKGKLKFTQTRKVRERKLSLWRPKSQTQQTQNQPKTVISLSRANSIQQGQGQGQTQGKSLKLKFGRRDSGLPLASFSPGGSTSLGQTSPTPPPPMPAQSPSQGRISETPKPELKLKLKLKPPGAGSPGA